MKNDVVHTASGPIVTIGSTASGPGDKGSGVVLDFLQIRPTLNAPEGRDYTLRARSPCIDRGIPVAGVNNSRSSGGAPDIGWHEQGLAQPVFGPRTE